MFLQTLQVLDGAIEIVCGEQPIEVLDLLPRRRRPVGRALARSVPLRMIDDIQALPARCRDGAFVNLRKRDLEQRARPLEIAG